MQKLNSPYDLFTAKSLPRAEQIELLNSINTLPLDPLTVDQLKAKFREVIPFSPDLSHFDILHYWALAIVLSDIACIQWPDRRRALAADLQNLSLDLTKDYRVVNTLSNHADWAISIMASCLRRGKTIDT